MFFFHKEIKQICCSSKRVIKIHFHKVQTCVLHIVFIPNLRSCLDSLISFIHVTLGQLGVCLWSCVLAFSIPINIILQSQPTFLYAFVFFILGYFFKTSTQKKNWRKKLILNIFDKKLILKLLTLVCRTI